MKHFIYLGFIILALVLSVQGQVTRPLADFGTMSVEDIDKAFKKRGVFGAVTYRQFADVALRSQRMDLLTYCFKSNDICYPLYEQTAALPESTFKDRVQIMMLRDDSGFWGQDPEEIRAYFGGRDFDQAADTFRPLINKYFPNMVVTAETIRRRAARNKLATDLEAAIAKQEEKASSSLKPTVSVPAVVATPPASEANNAAIPQSQSTKAVEPAKPIQNEPQSQDHGVLLWLAAILAALGGVWVLMRKGSR
jgi:hypothetical protein